MNITQTDFLFVVLKIVIASVLFFWWFISFCSLFYHFILFRQGLDCINSFLILVLLVFFNYR